MSECKECKGKGWIFSGFGEDYECETCFDKSPESENIVEQSQSDAWNDAGTKPDHPCLCETILDVGELASFQYWSGEYWGFACATTDQAIHHKNYRETSFAVIKWREVKQ